MTATSPGSFCALYPAYQCSRRARAASRLRLPRDKSDTCPHRCQATTENVDKSQDSDITERSLGSRATSSVLPLQAHRFHDGGEWAAILSGNLGDVLGLRGRIRLLGILGGIGFSATRVIAKGAR